MLERISLGRMVWTAVMCLALAASGGVEGAKKKKSKKDTGPKKVPYEEITDCPDDPGCPALIILDDSKLNNDQNYTTFIQRQIIKIFTEEGVDKYSDISVGAVKGGWEIKNLKGKTILPDGTEIHLAKENIHIKKFRRGKLKVRTKSATFPGVVPGALIAWQYTIKLESFRFMLSDTWDIQQELPVLKTRYSLKPGLWPMVWKQSGMEEVDVEVTEVSKRETVFTARNVRPIPTEPYGPSSRALGARMFFDIPERAEPWLAVEAAQYAGGSGSFIEDSPVIAEKAAELVASSDPAKEKVRKIYEFVQREIGTEEDRLGETEESQLEDAENAGEVLARGWGNEVERTLLFLALAKEVGLEYRLMLLSSRYNGPFDQEIPDTDAFDSYAAAIKVGRGWITYDPATPHCPLGMISAEKESGDDPNGIMILPDPDAGSPRLIKLTDMTLTSNFGAPYSLVRIAFSSTNKNLLTREATVKLTADGSGEMEMSETGLGQSDMDLRRKYKNLDESERQEKLLKRVQDMFQGAELLEATFENLASHDELASINCRVSAPALASSVGDRLIVTPSVFHSGHWNPFTADNRETPIHFPHPAGTLEQINFEIPEGYAIEALPEMKTIREAPFSMTMIYTPTENGFRFSRRVDIQSAAFPPEDYPKLRSFFERLQEADKQVVVLKKEAN